MKQAFSVVSSEVLLRARAECLLAPLGVLFELDTVADCMARISRRVRRGSCRFSELFEEDYTRQENVTMFMALLELIKLNRLHVKQDSPYEDITLSA